MSDLAHVHHLVAPELTIFVCDRHGMHRDAVLADNHRHFGLRRWRTHSNCQVPGLFEPTVAADVDGDYGDGDDADDDDDAAFGENDDDAAFDDGDGDDPDDDDDDAVDGDDD